MSPRTILTIALTASLLAGCGAPPCASDDGVRKASDAYGHCIRMQQWGDGGYQCGRGAYRTFCKADSK